MKGRGGKNNGVQLTTGPADPASEGRGGTTEGGRIGLKCWKFSANLTKAIRVCTENWYFLKIFSPAWELLPKIT